MENKKGNGIKLTTYLRTSTLLSIICLMCNWVTGVNSQTEEKMGDKTAAEQNQTSLQDFNDKIKKWIKTLKNNETKRTSPELVVEAIQNLGSVKAKQAIPELIKYLDYERKFESKFESKQDPADGVEVLPSIPLSGRYPAITALFQIGKSALPALAKVIQKEEPESLKSDNALHTVQFIFRDNLSEAVKYLEESMKNSDTQKAKQRLSIAIEKTSKEQLKIQNLKSN